MRQLYSIALMVLATLALASCDDASRLADKIQGTWSGAPQRLTDNLSNELTVVNNYTFTLDNGTKGGTFMLTAMVSATGAINNAQGIDQPFSLTAAGSATATGTWQATDGDEIAIIIDPQSIDVEVDPESVVLSNNMLTNVTTASTDSLKPHVIMLIQGAFKRSLTTSIMELHHLDDVEIHDNTMKYEVGHKHFTMMREGKISRIYPN
ncbi:MAG: hypothetical protein LIO90_00185 [Bacteroidales bacterium]|nr:hypothetical protein [Bacteroidales bacterium]